MFSKITLEALLTKSKARKLPSHQYYLTLYWKHKSKKSNFKKIINFWKGRGKIITNSRQHKNTVACIDYLRKSTGFQHIQLAEIKHLFSSVQSLSRVRLFATP